MRTPICDKLNIDVPIFAFSHCRNVVAEASKSGAFGVLGAVGFMPDTFARELDALDRESEGKPYGVDVIMPAKDAWTAESETEPAVLLKNLRAKIPSESVAFVKRLLAEHNVPELPPGEHHEGELLLRSTAATARRHVDIALSHQQVRLIVSGLGPLPADVTGQVHGAGRLIAGMCGTPAHALKHIAGGADIVVAQGAEGGGHASAIGSMVLWPELIEVARPIPVLAAGGIGSGAQIAASLIMGAEGAWLGSLWLTTVESDLTDPQKEALIEATYRDTVLSRSLTGNFVRMLRNDWTEAWARPDAPSILPLPLQDMVAAECTTRARAYPRPSKPISILPVGQIVGRMKRIERTRDVIYRLTEEYLQTLERFKGLLDAEA